MKDKDCWTQLVLARDEKGKICGLDNASSYCLAGAVLKCYGAEGADKVGEVEAALLRHINMKTGAKYLSLHKYNDRKDLKHKDLLKVLEKFDY